MPPFPLLLRCRICFPDRNNAIHYCSVYLELQDILVLFISICIFSTFIQVLAFIHPFDLVTWVLIACTIFAAVAFLVLSNNVQESLHSNAINLLVFKLGASALYVFSLAMMQSHNYTYRPSSISIRAGIASMLFFFFFISRVR
jgi:hypothetical protein